MVTLRDIAIRSGVSISTASRALSDHEYVRADTRARVQDVARELSYAPNKMARGLRRNQTRAIGLVLPDMRNSSFSSEAAAFLQRELQESGYGLVLYVTRYDHETELRCLDRLRAQQVDGIVHVPASSASAENLTKGSLPIPVVEFLRRSSASNKLDAVLYDDEEGANRVVAHLLQLGHRRIGVITGPRGAGPTTRRLAGAYRAVAEAGLDPDVLHFMHGEYAPETGRQAFRRLLDIYPPHTAIFATSTQFVLGVMLASKESRVDIPGQISLAGFGDPEWGQLLSAPLTTYKLPLQEMAMTAALLMTSRIERKPSLETHPIQITISGTLMVRSSTAPPS